ncbi:hypothetical protein [Pontixanthobacter sp. CEM42]|uniref:hypothetical protein n=1 Tax=Pontixanthobacter sp. CEM42 TaxID=2792077 RepID=UPI001ADF746A|nr:hypothetical protein [Pontixanthobacter sp. CEM42]
MNENKVRRAIIDRDGLPQNFPTQSHPPEFWEQLGRTVASFGFLEETLGKAIFAFTATREYRDDEVEEAILAWLPQLERALSDQLWNLAETFNKVTKDHQATTIANVAELVEDIKAATVVRNVLCHGSWQKKPDKNGASVPLFVNRNTEIFQTPIDVAYLAQVQRHVVELACSVIDTVTHMGWQFPGSGGPGQAIWNRTANDE